jgi:hypothetical protein
MPSPIAYITLKLLQKQINRHLKSSFFNTLAPRTTQPVSEMAFEALECIVTTRNGQAQCVVSRNTSDIVQI